MSHLKRGDAVLVRGIVTDEGVWIGDRLVPADQALVVVSDVPDFVSEDAGLVMLFNDEVERANFAASFRGLPGVDCRNL